jgi:hypothetical protein
MQIKDQGIEDIKKQGDPKWQVEGPIQVTIENHREFFGALDILDYKKESDMKTDQEMSQKRLGIPRRIFEAYVAGAGTKIFIDGDRTEDILKGPHEMTVTPIEALSPEDV